MHVQKVLSHETVKKCICISDVREYHNENTLGQMDDYIAATWWSFDGHMYHVTYVSTI